MCVCVCVCCFDINCKDDFICARWTGYCCTNILCTMQKVYIAFGGLLDMQYESVHVMPRGFDVSGHIVKTLYDAGGGRIPLSHVTL